MTFQTNFMQWTEFAKLLNAGRLVLLNGDTLNHDVITVSAILPDLKLIPDNGNGKHSWPSNGPCPSRHLLTSAAQNK